MLPDATSSHTICVDPIRTPMGTIWIVFVCLTTRMNPSTQSAQSCGSLYLVLITTVYSWPCEHNTHRWVRLHLVAKVDIAFPAGRHCSNWRIWFSEVPLKWNAGKEGIRPWKGLSRSFSSLCVYRTQMLWASEMIHWLVCVFSTLQSCPRCSIEVGLWNGRR